MKKCYHFPTWEEQKDVMISLDEKTILFVNAVKTNLYGLTQIIEHNQDSLIIAKKIARDGLETMIIEQSTQSDPILAKLCELTGAKMYGDYVVLNECGDIYQKYYFYVHNHKESDEYCLTYNMCEEIKLGNDRHNISHKMIKRYEMDRNLNACPKNCQCTQYSKKFNNALGERTIDDLDEGHKESEKRTGNIFQEYSLYLQGKENRWEEMKKVLGL